MKRLATVIVAVVAGSQLGATDCGQIIEDPGFDHWCGEQLCYWKTERGEVRRAPTWRAGDDGVEFVGDDVAISQQTAVTSFDTDCIRFEFLADVAETTEVNLEADVFGDGTVDWVERVPTSRWEKVSFLIGVAGTYQGILFRLTKAGEGRAVLAQISAEEAEGCPSFVEIETRPLGALCDGSQACESGVCNGEVCSTCSPAAPCEAGTVCGREDDAPGHLADWWTCVPEGSRALAELCRVGAECATGICNGLQCIECNDPADCPGTGSTCGSASEEVRIARCDAESGTRATGAACVVDADCASGTCEGRPWGHCDGDPVGPICFEDDHCPRVGEVFAGVCTFVAVAGGTCQ